MQLLQEIIELLSASKPDLGNALFKAQVLAHRLGEQGLKEWVSSELKGYSDNVSVPPYRSIQVTVHANISNGVYRYNDHPLPMLSVDKRLRDMLEVTRLVQSIAVIEEWSKNDKNLVVTISPDFYGHLKKGLDPSFEIERAWGQHSIGAMLQVVVEVRSRLLELALQIADRIPMEPAPEVMKELSQEAAVSEIFKNAVFGSNTTIVVGSGAINGVTNSYVVTNDVSSLARVLGSYGVQEDDVQALRSAIEVDEGAADHQTKRLGPAVTGWLSGLAAKAAEGVYQIGIAGAGGLVTNAVAAYYGFS